jgi:hypothetical protein
MKEKVIYKKRFNEGVETKDVFILDNTLWFSWNKGTGTTVTPIYLNRNKLKGFTDNPKAESMGMETNKFDTNNWNNWARFTKPIKRIGENGLYAIPRYYNDSNRDNWMMYGGNKKPDELIYVTIKKEGGYTYVALFTRKGEALSWLKN